MSESFGMGPDVVRDPKQFLMLPKTLQRLLTFTLSFISFCCIASIVDVHGCIFHLTSTCGFVKFVTSLGFVHCLIFLVCDWYFPSPRGFLDTTQKRRMCVMYEMIFSALWTLFYFSMFFACVAGWKKANADENSDENNLHLGAGNAKAIMAFGFFSIGLWGYQAWLAAQKFQSGNFALPQYDDESMAGAKPFASFPAPNVSQSNTFGADQSQLRPADLTY